MKDIEDQLKINSSEYDPRFVDLIKALELCAYSNIDCDRCPVEVECRQLFDSLADRKTHYKISQADYDKFMTHFKGLKKQLILC